MGKVDFGQVSNSYARAREDIPTSLMDSLLIRNISFEGKKIADIGAGTGALTRKIAMRKGEIIGIEPSQELIEQAKVLNITKNYRIPYRQGTAECTGLAGSQYDMVTVMRAWHWFDREKAINEIRRILKPNGKLLVIDSGFLSEHAVVQKTFEVLSQYVEGGVKPAGSKADAKQRINGFPVEWFEEWHLGGLELQDFFKLNYTVSFTKQTWVERMRSVSWLVSLEEPVRKQALRDLFVSLPDDEPYLIPHDCNVCILAKKVE